jgi:hypothetical protein
LETERQQQQVNNMNYVTESALNMRLGVDDHLFRFELFLRGKKITQVADENGVLKPIEVNAGEPKLNEEGVQSILGFVSAIVSTPNVMGNIDDFRFGNFLYRTRIDISNTLLYNVVNWEVKENYMSYIVDMAMSTVELFVSRTIDNGERDSLSNTVRISENSKSQEQFAK